MKKEYLFLIIIFVFITSCSDWEKDPIEIVKTVPAIEEPTGILLNTNFPKNASAFCFADNGAFLLGTMDGIFYKSYDYGKNWTKTGEMRIKDKINFIKKENEDKLINFVIAGTNKGGYLSKNFGNSWKEALPAEGINGNWCVLKSGGITPNALNSITIYFYGFDGKYDNFWSLDTGAVWGYYISNNPISNSIEEASFYNEKTLERISVYNIDKASAIKVNNYYTTIFNENLELMAAAILKDAVSGVYRYFAGSKHGILVSTDYGINWPAKFLSDYKIYTFSVYKKLNQLYAGTSNGLYVTINGTYWLKVNIWDKTEAIVYTYLWNDCLYFVTGSGETYYFKIPDESEQKIYVPILEKPANNSICESPLKLSWSKMDDYNKVNYRLQIAEEPAFNMVIIDTTILENYYQTELKKRDIKYYWRVCSSKIWGSSPWSDVWSFTVR